MNDDLVKRLRSLGSAGPGRISFLASEDAMKAADRIEKDAAHIDEMYELVAAMNNDHTASKTRIEKLEAALRALKSLHDEGGIGDLQERDDATYFMVCDALEGKDG